MQRPHKSKAEEKNGGAHTDSGASVHPRNMPVGGEDSDRHVNGLGGGVAGRVRVVY